MLSHQCVLCKHYNGVLKCDAFPMGIPQEIISGLVSHKEPYKGDNGIQFEKEK